MRIENIAKMRRVCPAGRAGFIKVTPKPASNYRVFQPAK
jgi:hypothetical protein